MIEWVQCIEKVLGVGQSGVSIEDFELLNMVGKGSYGRVIQVSTIFLGKGEEGEREFSVASELYQAYRKSLNSVRIQGFFVKKGPVLPS